MDKIATEARRIFRAVSALAGTERASAVRRTCGWNADLQTAVERLLDAASSPVNIDKTRVRVEAGEFRERPVAELTLRNSLGLAYLDLGDQEKG